MLLPHFRDDVTEKRGLFGYDKEKSKEWNL